MVKKLLNLKIRFFIFTLLFLGAISVFANTAATTNTSFSLLKNKAVVNGINNSSNTYGENFSFSNNLSFVNFLWTDTPTAEAGFKEVFQNLEVVLLKGEVVTAPTVTTEDVSYLTGTSVTLNGKITDLGSPDIVQHGFCWNTNGSPIISDDKTELGTKSTAGTFSSAIIGLNECTTYYVRAYADNGSGPVYGDVVSFTTLDVTPPITPTLANVNVGQCSGTPVAPTTTDACAGTITGTTLTVFPITAQGTTIVTWTFNDGNGNSTTANQNVIVDDVTKPVKPTLSDVTGECTATAVAPTTTDVCKGTITGTTTDPLTYTTQGTHVITWTFDDGSCCTFTSNI
jgi:hypothetical protein